MVTDGKVWEPLAYRATYFSVVYRMLYQLQLSIIPYWYTCLFYSFISDINSNHNQSHISATECLSGKLASINVVTPLTTLSALGSNHHSWVHSPVLVVHRYLQYIPVSEAFFWQFVLECAVGCGPYDEDGSGRAGVKHSDMTLIVLWCLIEMEVRGVHHHWPSLQAFTKIFINIRSLGTKRRKCKVSSGYVHRKLSSKVWLRHVRSTP